jgi:PTS system nitrogen regulatory IIA component
MKNIEAAQAFKIHELLKEPLIIPELQALDREGCLREMTRCLSAYDKRFSEAELLEKLVKRERLGSTAVGEGCAIPHCKVNGLEEPLILLAVSRKGIPVDSMDGKPAYVFILVVSPSENPSLNLQILASVARMIRESRQLLKKIRKSRSGREILNIIRQEEENLA